MGARRKTLALDVATRTGWACNSDPLQSGYADFKAREGEAPGFRFVRFHDWLKKLIAVTAPDEIVFEKPFISELKNSDVARIAYGFTTTVEEVGAQLGLPVRLIHNKTVKAFATGNGNANKEMMTAAANARFAGRLPRPVTDDNEGDALCILAWVEAGMPEPPPKPRKRAKNPRCTRAK